AVSAPMATRPSAVSPTTGKGWKLLRQQRRRSFHHGDAVLHGPLHLLQGADLDLAHALARHAELGGQVLERDRIVGKPAGLAGARSLSTESSSPGAFRRLSDSPLPTSRVSWSETSSTSQSCHSPQSPSSRIGEFSDTSPPRRRFMSITSVWVTPSCRAMIFTWSGRKSPWSSTEILLLALRRVKNSFFWLTVVPTSPATTNAGCIPGSPP